MATEVLLMADVKDLGDAGEVVRVADGFARNYLLPRKLAAPATAATRRRLAKLQAEREAAKVAEREAAQALAGRIAKLSCTIAVKASSEQKLYGSVTAADIAQAIKGQGVALAKEQILLEAPIKELGIFNVTVALHDDVQTSLKVWVVEE